MNTPFLFESEPFELDPYFEFEQDKYGFESEYEDWENFEDWEDEVSRSSAEYVRWIQASLNKIMKLKLAVDGILGTMTRSAIRSFQQQQGLTVDGTVGPITEGALIRAGASQPPGGAGASPNPYNPPSGGGSTPSGSPVSCGRISSGFGYRASPITGERSMHTGVDIAGLPVGTSINATGGGTVIFAGDGGGYGNLVKIDHGGGYLTYYAHLNSISVRQGQTVSRGQKVGELGATGRVTGPHLHYEVRRNGDPIDPAPFMNAPPAQQQNPAAGATDIVSVRGIQVARQIASNVEALLAAAAADGVKLSGGGYRSTEQQVKLRIAHCGGNTHYHIYEKPSAECKPPTAPPGRSNHEKGLAIDFTYNGSIINSRSNPGFVWLSRNAAKFGLYNLPSEPWHWSVNGK